VYPERGSTIEMTYEKCAGMVSGTMGGNAHSFLVAAANISPSQDKLAS
jgi:hypothetical protein